MGSQGRDRHQAARVAGLAYLLSFATLIAVNFAILEPLVGHATPTEIARNVLAHQTLYRLGLTGLLINCAGILIASVGLYVVLEPVHRMWALAAMIGRLVYGLTWLLLAINAFTALRLLTQPEYRGLSADQLAILARLHLSGHDLYYVGLLFWSLAATIGALLWFRSEVIPRALAVFGALAGTWCTICTLALNVAPGFSNVVDLWLFDTPMVLFEIIVCSILLIRAVPSDRRDKL
jgi:hypothetical protein